MSDLMTAPAPSGSAGDLLERVGMDDEAAFAELYDLMAPRIYGLALRIIREPALAAEVTQEAWVDVWRSAPSFDSGRGSAQGWLLTLTHRRAVDHVRSVRAMVRRDVAYHEGHGSRSYDVTESTAFEGLDAQRVRAALALLTTAQREALVLAYFEGLTHLEVAARLGLPLGTAKTRIRDGLHRLRTLLADD